MRLQFVLPTSLCLSGRSTVYSGTSWLYMWLRCVYQQATIVHEITMCLCLAAMSVCFVHEVTMCLPAMSMCCCACQDFEPCTRERRDFRWNHNMSTNNEILQHSPLCTAGVYNATPNSSPRAIHGEDICKRNINIFLHVHIHWDTVSQNLTWMLPYICVPLIGCVFIDRKQNSNVYFMMLPQKLVSILLLHTTKLWIDLPNLVLCMYVRVSTGAHYHKHLTRPVVSVL